MQDEGQQRVEIVNDQSGERYGVTIDSFHELYASRGYRIDRFEDGRPYRDEEEAGDADGQDEAEPVAVVTEVPAEAAPVEAAPAAPTEAAPTEAA